MAGLRFHRFLAIVVLVGSVAWVATGEFSSVGSSTGDAHSENQATPLVESAEASAPVLRSVSVVTPEFVEHARSIRLSGLTSADKRAVLAAQTSGAITSLNVTKGQRVQKGDVIISLDGPEKIAAIETAKALLVQRNRESQVAEQLLARGNIPELQVDSAHSAQTAAEAQLKQAQAEVGHLEVRAPFDGVIDTIEIEQGSWVQTGAQVAVILSLDPIIATGEVSELDVGHIQTGSKAEIRLANGRTATGEVRFIGNEASPLTRTFPVEIEISNPNNQLPSGMTTEITLRTDPVRAVVVPRSVITLSQDGTLGVRIIDPNDVTAFVEVELIDDIPEGLVIGGVPADARIVVSGQDLVEDGKKVIPHDVGSLAAASSGAGQ